MKKPCPHRFIPARGSNSLPMGETTRGEDLGLGMSLDRVCGETDLTEAEVLLESEER
jgi:hypothetical protein